ncbi:MAG: hypothetical protein U9Q97_01925 [Acidobacteriota bacterium]|nr:hypothetical protein [Acidobacteriota bacterium]
MKNIKRIVHKAKTFKNAEEWDILQQIRMSPEERQAVSFALRKRVYGSNPPDVREAYKSK